MSTIVVLGPVAFVDLEQCLSEKVLLVEKVVKRHRTCDVVYTFHGWTGEAWCWPSSDCGG